MPSSHEVWASLYGAWRLTRLDRNGAHFFNLSHPGVWRSFWAAAICYPAFLLLLRLRLDAATIAQSSFLHILIVETVGYVTGWVAFPLLALGFAKRIRREEQGFDFIVAYNWSQVLQMALLLAVALTLDQFLAGNAAANVNLAAYVAILFYEWFVALVMLGAGPWAAVAIVFIDIVLGSALALVTGSLY